MKFNIDVNGKTVTAEGTYLDALRAAGAEEGALAVRSGGETCELGWELNRDCAIKPLTLADDEGQRVYERSLMFLLLMALKREYPNGDVQVEHSLPQGLYMEIKGVKFISRSVVKCIEDAMRELAAQDVPFEMHTVSREEAIRIFEEQNQQDKVRLLRYREKDSIRIYSAGGIRNYFYGEMVPSTGYLKLFALELRGQHGIVLRMPKPDRPDALPDTPAAPRLAEVFARSEKWGEILDASLVADLNEMIEKGGIRQFIRINEALHEKTISHIADEIYEAQPRIILVAGPSSSGKTTFTNRLGIQLRVNGMEPVMISLDNYYLDRDAIPLEADGTRDFESLYALDVEYFNRQLVQLLQGEEVELPVFEFLTGKRSERGTPIRLRDGQPILIEGIHGLNDDLTYDIPREYKYKIFVTALTQLNLDNYNRIRSTDCRLIRRLTRDFETRGSTMENTLSMWRSVRKGEEKWIFPFQEQADYIFNSSLTYELAVIKKYLYPLLTAVPVESEYYSEARRLVKFLNYIKDADVEDEIPPTSILREFIGGNTFYR